MCLPLGLFNLGDVVESLKSIGDRLGTDKFKSTVNYTESYLKYFEPIREKEVTLLEIGIAQAAGLATWKEYFVNAKVIVGMENFNKHHIQSRRDTMYANCEKHGVDAFIGDQASREDLSRLVGMYGPFDIIIDDGGHFMSQQQISLGFLFEYLNPGGIFVMEDLVTSVPGFRNDCHKDFPPGLEDHQRVTTHDVLKELQDSGFVYSPFMTDDEMTYLEDNYETCELFESCGIYYEDGKWPSEICMITKKK